MSKVNGNSISPPSEIPRHIAIIMDGNGRWAKGHGYPRVKGHQAGAKTVRMVVEEARRLGVRHLTLYCFSSENWKRPEAEVSALMRLFRQYLESELELLLKNDIRLRTIGEISRLPTFVQDILKEREEATVGLTGMDLVLAVSYGGRDEILSAVRGLVRDAVTGKVSPDQINESSFSNYLYAPDIPDPDLLIRTSNEFRISNFLLWQLAYAEIVVSPLLWPDFSKEELYRCLHEFAGRERRFGLTEAQVSGGERTSAEPGSSNLNL